MDFRMGFEWGPQFGKFGTGLVQMGSGEKERKKEEA